jgi:hypothetical protein
VPPADTIADTPVFEAHSELAIAAKTGVKLAVSGFKATDTLNLTTFKFSSSEKLSFVENKAKTSGTLTVTDGTLTASVTLFGQHVSTGFHLAKDGAGTATPI